MVIFFPNGTLTLWRVMPVPGAPGTAAPQIIATNLTAHIEPVASTSGVLRAGIEFNRSGHAIDDGYQLTFDTGLDIKMGDRISGYNPRNLTPAPFLAVQRVSVYEGLLGHIEVLASEARDPAVA